MKTFGAVVASMLVLALIVGVAVSGAKTLWKQATDPCPYGQHSKTVDGNRTCVENSPLYRFTGK
jgi:hypothetical protein